MGVRVIAAKTVLFTVVVPGTVCGLVPYWLASRGGSVAVRWDVVHAFGLIPLALGACIYFRCAWDFVVAGKGTPAPIDPPRELVVRGLYRWVRNPMYLGVLLVLFNEAWVLGSLAVAGYAAAVFLAFHAFVTLYEEPALRRRFGEAYADYCATVPRWWPRRMG